MWIGIRIIIKLWIKLKSQVLLEFNKAWLFVGDFLLHSSYPVESGMIIRMINRED